MRPRRKKLPIMGSNTTLASLPEDCIATIISLTSPKDACVVCAVSSGFKSAAESDTVWERYLPSDNKEIIASDHRLNGLSSLKELYLKLCDRPILLDEGKLSLRLIKPTGKKCYMLCARELSIAWKDNPIYWRWTSLPESRFAEVAQLHRVCWLDIAGTMQASILSPNSNYKAHLVFKVAEDYYGLSERTKATVDYADENETREANIVYIVSPQPVRRRTSRHHAWQVSRPTSGLHPRERTDGWNEIELGGIFMGRNEKRHIRCRLHETECRNWKGGLFVEGIELRPIEYSS